MIKSTTVVLVLMLDTFQPSTNISGSNVSVIRQEYKTTETCMKHARETNKIVTEHAKKKEWLQYQSNDEKIRGALLGTWCLRILK